MDETHLIDLQRKEINGEYIYFDSQGNFFDNKGEVINKVKFESCVDETYQLTNKEEEKEKEQKEQVKEQKNLQTMPLSEKMLAETKEYTQKLLEMILEKYEGQTVGEGDFTLESLMQDFFDAPPEEKKGKKAKKKKEKSEEPKKPKALSGYTLFSKENKEEFNKEMSELDEKPKYVSFASGKWKELSDEEKGEWNQKAKDLKEQA
tara:strand:+ start:108 stop:722 length:615 start_codon:yes stop_codon:yes gene_type:complete